MLPRFDPSASPEERGLLRAVVQGVKVQHLHDSTYLASSVSRPGASHVVSAAGCDCEAAQAGRHCKHVAAVQLAEQEAAELRAQARQDVEDLFGKE